MSDKLKGVLVYITPELHKKFRQKVLQNDVPMKKVISEFIQEYVNATPEIKKKIENDIKILDKETHESISDVDIAKSATEIEIHQIEDIDNDKKDKEDNRSENERRQKRDNKPNRTKTKSKRHNRNRPPLHPPTKQKPSGASGGFFGLWR